jgi:hypothetical protein
MSMPTRFGSVGTRDSLMKACGPDGDRQNIQLKFQVMPGCCASASLAPQATIAGPFWMHGMSGSVHLLTKGEAAEFAGEEFYRGR